MLHRSLLLPPSRFPTRRPVVVLPVLVALFLLTACPLEFEDLESPRVVDVTVAPSSIHYTETGDHNQHFVIAITIANFDDEIVDAKAFVQLNGTQRDAHGNWRMDGDNEIILEDIEYTWLTGLEPGEYDIGVEVRSSTVQLIERNRDRINIDG